MVCPLNCCHALQQSSHSLVLWWMPAVGAAKHQQGLRVCGLLGLELVHWNAIQMNLGMDNKQQEVTYKFMQNLIICILKTKKENGCLILFYFFFFFLMACGILVPHQGLKLCPCSGITVLTTGEGVLVTQLCLTLCKLMAIACQAPLSLGFSRQEYWSE